MKKKDVTGKKVDLTINERISTLFADSTTIYMRHDEKMLLSFKQQLPPDINIEVARLIVDNSHAKQIIELLCRNLDYYPAKKEAKK